MLWTIVKWIIKFVIAFILLVVHWLLFALFIFFLAYRTWSRQRRAEALRLAEEDNDGRVYREFELFASGGVNDDGVSRQQVLEKCYRGDAVTLKYNPTEDDANRVEVWTRFGQIGLIAPFFVEQHAAYFKSGNDVEGRIKRVNTSAPETSCVLEIAFDE